LVLGHKHLIIPAPFPPSLAAHPFFRGLNWKMLEMRKLEPPLLPSLAQGALDVSNFDAK
jgi:hypothetical protein